MKKVSWFAFAVICFVVACLLAMIPATAKDMSGDPSISMASGETKEAQFTLHAKNSQLSYVVPADKELVIEYVGGFSIADEVPTELLESAWAVMIIDCNPEPDWQGKPLRSFIYNPSKQAVPAAGGYAYVVYWTISQCVKLIFAPGTCVVIDFGPPGVNYRESYFTGYLQDANKIL